MADKRKRDSSEKEKTFTIILSILIALFLWAYVLGEVNPTTQQTIANIPVQLLNTQSLAARELSISGDGKYTINVLVEGKRADIMNINVQDINAEADLFGWSKGENYIPVNVTVPESLKILEVKSAKILVNIEDLIALSKPVDIIFRGELPGDTEEGGIITKPSEIEVTGARSEVESVTQVQVTVDISDLTAQGETVQVAATAVNAAGMPVENVKLSANYVQIFAKLMRTKEVALVTNMTGEMPAGFGAEISVPTTIKVKGSREALQDLESVTAEPVDLTGLTGTGTISIKAILPDGVELARGFENIIAGITIEEASTKIFQYSADEILLEGLTEGKSITIDVPNIVITVTGRNDIVENMTRNDIKLYIDAANLPEGPQTVTLQTSYEAILHSIVLEPAEITINLKTTE